MTIGVLLAALGTPDAPTAPALRRYLREFLSDRRVVDIHPLIWQPILNLIILNRRPARSAALYRRIWTDDGSPLLLISQEQTRGLAARLGDRFRVALGMRYGQPSIAQAIAELAAAGCDRLVVLPMFPQFSSATTASVYDAVYRAAAGRRCPLFFERTRFVPTLRFVPPYPELPAYIEAQAHSIRSAGGSPQHYVFSFHGVPQRYADEGDPYPVHCLATAERLAAALNLRPDQWSLTFQSRFGREPWLQPYTDEHLEALAQRGVKRILVASPGFTADCLETLDEIAHEARDTFLHAGGESFTYAPCVNAQDSFLDGLAALVKTEAAGWIAARPTEREVVFSGS